MTRVERGIWAVLEWVWRWVWSWCLQINQHAAAGDAWDDRQRAKVSIRLVQDSLGIAYPRALTP